jgi:hypothetical protein
VIVGWERWSQRVAGDIEVDAIVAISAGRF